MAHPAAASTPHPHHRNSLTSALSPLDTSTPRAYHPLNVQPYQRPSIYGSSSLSNNSGCRARFEFESGKGNEGTKILMIEWDADVDTSGHANDGDEWHIWWEGKSVVLPADDRKGGTEEVTRLYYLLPPGVSVPAMITLTRIPFKTNPSSMGDGDKGERNGSKSPSAPERTWRANPLPAIYPPELGATARSAGKKGVLHTKWAKARLRSLQKEIDEESKKNVEGVALIMAMQEKEWIEQNFGVSSRPAPISIGGIDLSGAEAPRSPPSGTRSPTSPRSPGGSRLSEKLKGLKLGTSDKELGTARQSAITLSMSGGSIHSNPLSPEGSDVAVSSYAAIRGTNLNAALLKSPQGNRPFMPLTPMTAVRMMPQSPPPLLVQQQSLAELGSLDAVARSPLPLETPTTAISTSSRAFAELKGELARGETPKSGFRSAGNQTGHVQSPVIETEKTKPEDGIAEEPASEPVNSEAGKEKAVTEEIEASVPTPEPVTPKMGFERAEAQEVKVPVNVPISQPAEFEAHRTDDDTPVEPTYTKTILPGEPGLEALDTELFPSGDDQAEPNKLEEVCSDGPAAEPSPSADVQVRQIGSEAVNIVETKVDDTVLENSMPKSAEISGVDSNGITHEDVKLDNITPEESKPVVIGSEGIKAEDIKVEHVKLEDVKLEDVKLQDVTLEDITSEDFKRVDVKLEKASPEDITPDHVNSEEAETEDLNPKSVEPEEPIPGTVKLEDVTPEVVKPEATKPHDGSPKDALLDTVQSPEVSLESSPEATKPIEDSLSAEEAIDPAKKDGTRGEGAAEAEWQVEERPEEGLFALPLRLLRERQSPIAPIAPIASAET